MGTRMDGGMVLFWGGGIGYGLLVDHRTSSVGLVLFGGVFYRAIVCGIAEFSPQYRR